jgi:hypothetical protein
LDSAAHDTTGTSDGVASATTQSTTSSLTSPSSSWGQCCVPFWPICISRQSTVWNVLKSKQPIFCRSCSP